MVYKIISHLLADRLKQILLQAVLHNQTGFLKGRLLVENVHIATEILSDSDNPDPITRGCLKIDLVKAFDHIDWSFILNCLTALRFPNVFVGWIAECITSPSYSIAFNGKFTGYFKGRKGLRQGDSIAPYLFVSAMDVLSRQLNAALTHGLFGAHPKCHSTNITHLSFADDVFILFDGSQGSLSSIIHILEDLHTLSGLGLNKQKSNLFLNEKNQDQIALISVIHGLTPALLPVRYLGLPLNISKLTKSDF